MIILKTSLIPGTSIHEASREAIKLCNKLECAIEFSFNGINCFIFPHMSLEHAVNTYLEKAKQLTKENNDND